MMMDWVLWVAIAIAVVVAQWRVVVRERLRWEARAGTFEAAVQRLGVALAESRAAVLGHLTPLRIVLDTAREIQDMQIAAHEDQRNAIGQGFADVLRRIEGLREDTHRCHRDTTVAVEAVRARVNQGLLATEPPAFARDEILDAVLAGCMDAGLGTVTVDLDLSKTGKLHEVLTHAARRLGIRPPLQTVGDVVERLQAVNAALHGAEGGTE